MSSFFTPLSVVAPLAFFTAMCPQPTCAQREMSLLPDVLAATRYDPSAGVVFAARDRTTEHRLQNPFVRTSGHPERTSAPDFETQWIFLGDSEATEIGLETSLAGLELGWFGEKSGEVDLSVHPELEFDIGSLQADDSSLDAREELLIPLEVEKTLGPFLLTHRAGLLLTPEETDRWAVAFAASYEVSDYLEVEGELQGTAKSALEDEEWTYELVLLYELFPRVELSAAIEGATDGDFEEHGLLFHLGVRSEVTEGLGVLVAAGGNFPDSPEGRGEVLLYSGLQWTF